MIAETELLERAAEVLRAGGVIVVPTETFYGLAADPFREEAVSRIFKIKCRPEGKPLPLIGADKDLVSRLVGPPSDLARAMMDRFWPGSLTIVFHPVLRVPRLVCSKDGKIAVRVPPPCAARAVARLAGGWITATSANLSGDPDPDEVSRIAKAVRESVDLIVDLGPTPGGKPSTVVEPLFTGVRLIREGAVSKEELEDLPVKLVDRESS
jgi:L-threonylcarbamoyladenylate synthase